MDVKLLIGDRDANASDGKTFPCNNPLSGKSVTNAAAATVADAQTAVDAASVAFPAWAAIGPSARREMLLKAADKFEEKRGAFVETMINEIGTTEVWAQFNVKLAAGIIREAAAMTTQIGGEVIPSDKPGCVSMAVRQAAGVCVGIAPWNAPIILGVRAVAMPLACGNTVVLKASELCPGTHRLIGDVFRDAGFPAGTVNVISNAPEDAAAVVGALIAAPAVKRINFTGSTRVGRVIATTAAQHLKPVLLELGGKAPLIVLDDADLDAAVNAVAFGAFINQGQVCMSTERVIVDNSVADEFVRKLASKASSLPSGDPRTKRVVVGSMISVNAAKHAEALIAEAVADGAVKVAGGEREGTILPATVLDHVTPKMRIFVEESFGPSVSVIRVSSVEEAIKVANDTEYGLSAAVFSKDVARALTIAARIETGICHINGPTVHDEAQMPFGGVKGSGYGRFGGKAGVDEFTDLRWITIETGPQHYPF